MITGISEEVVISIVTTMNRYNAFYIFCVCRARRLLTLLSDSMLRADGSCTKESKEGIRQSSIMSASQDHMHVI